MLCRKRKKGGEEKMSAAQGNYKSSISQMGKWKFNVDLHSSFNFITLSCSVLAFFLTHVPSVHSLFLFFRSNTGFLCLVIYRRDTHVVELQIGNLTSRLEDACAPDQYDVSRTPFTTLLGMREKNFPQIFTSRNAVLKQWTQKSAALFAGDEGKPLNNSLINFHFKHKNILTQWQPRRQNHRNVPSAGRIH